MTDTTTRPATAAGTFQLGGDLTVNRLGYGTMQLTGEGVWGEPDDRDVPGDASSPLLTDPDDNQIPRFTHSGPQNRGLDSQRPEGVDPQTTTRLFASTRPVHIS